MAVICNDETVMRSLLCYSTILLLKKHLTLTEADDILIFYLYLSKKIRLDASSESSAQQRIHLKHHVLFSLKNNEKNIYECRLLQSRLAL